MIAALLDEDRPRLRPASLVLPVVIGLIMWFLYGLETSLALFGNCGPEGFLGRAGTWHGGAYESFGTAGIIGGVLIIVTWLGLGLLRIRWEVLVFSFAGVYAGSLLLLGFVIAPAIWGPRYCVT